MQAIPTALLIERPLIFSTVYDLAAVVFGSEGLARLSTGDQRDEFDKLRIRHEVAQATKLLIEVAVVLRNLMDGDYWPMDLIHESRIERRPEADVGFIREAGALEKPLRFRDACNKLIHAKKISFEMAELAERVSFMDGTVELHGDLHGKEWIAKIHLADFIRMAVRQL
jgi:hypothetical protein